MFKLRKLLYDSAVGQRIRQSKAGVATLEHTARILQRLPPPKQIFDAGDTSWQQFFYFEQGGMPLPERLDEEFQELLAEDRSLCRQITSVRTSCPTVGMVFSSGRAGTRGLSLYLHQKPGLAALHRPGDVTGFKSSGVEVDPGERNSIIYQMMLGPRDRDWWARHIRYVLSLLEFASSLDQREFWLTAHRWNCYFPLIELILGRRSPALLLDRDDRKIVHSMVTRNQYCPVDADPDRASTWVNVEPQFANRLAGDASRLKLTGAPLFDRVVWYVQFVRYWFNACTAGRSSNERGTVEIDCLAAKPEESFRILDSVVGLESNNPDGLRDQFQVPKNTKPRSTQTGLRFPDITDWPEPMDRRLVEIRSRWEGDGTSTSTQRYD